VLPEGVARRNRPRNGGVGVLLRRAEELFSLQRRLG